MRSYQSQGFLYLQCQHLKQLDLLPHQHYLWYQLIKHYDLLPHFLDLWCYPARFEYQLLYFEYLLWLMFESDDQQQHNYQQMLVHLGHSYQVQHYYFRRQYSQSLQRNQQQCCRSLCQRRHMLYYQLQCFQYLWCLPTQYFYLLLCCQLLQCYLVKHFVQRLYFQNLLY